MPSVYYFMSPTLPLLGLPWLAGKETSCPGGDNNYHGECLCTGPFCWDKIDKEVVDRTVSNCQCLLLSFGGLLSEESRCKGLRHLSPCGSNQSIYSSDRSSCTVQLVLTIHMRSPRALHLGTHTGDSTDYTGSTNKVNR